MKHWPERHLVWARRTYLGQKGWVRKTLNQLFFHSYFEQSVSDDIKESAVVFTNKKRKMVKSFGGEMLT
jgi:hypothetical protein